jgi:hypothetical protein
VREYERIPNMDFVHIHRFNRSKPFFHPFAEPL